jgi:hypothetical protein
MMAAPLFEALLPRTTKTALRWLYRCIVGVLTIVIAASNCVPVDAIALAQPGSLRPIEALRSGTTLSLTQMTLPMDMSHG